MKKNCLLCSKSITCKILKERRKDFDKIISDEKIEEALKPCQDFAEDMDFSNIFTKSLMNIAANSRQVLPTIHIDTININISIEKK